jgi:hypothetical protein
MVYGKVKFPRSNITIYGSRNQLPGFQSQRRGRLPQESHLNCESWSSIVTQAFGSPKVGECQKLHDVRESIAILEKRIVCLRARKFDEPPRRLVWVKLSLNCSRAGLIHNPPIKSGEYSFDIHKIQIISFQRFGARTDTE